MASIKVLVSEEVDSRLSGWLKRLFVAFCSKTISPKSRARAFGRPRNIMAPPKGTPAFSLNGLEANAESARVLLSDAGIAREIMLTSVILAGVTPDEIMLNVYVGGELVEEFTGEQLDPATANPCVGAACGVSICAGEIERVEFSVTNLSAAPLGATDAIRLFAREILDGDPRFVGCWSKACAAAGIAEPKVPYFTPEEGKDCACELEPPAIG